MGRHSAPDEEDESTDLGTTEAGAAPAAAEHEPAHARRAPAEAEPEPAEAERTPARAEPAAAGAESAAAGPPPSGTAADLAMLRSDRALRARAAAAAVVPFFLYVIVLLVIGRFDVLLIWIWVPAVTAGILVGALLDRAAARRKKVSGAR